jgi:hypothetical protein
VPRILRNSARANREEAFVGTMWPLINTREYTLNL